MASSVLRLFGVVGRRSFHSPTSFSRITLPSSSLSLLSSYSGVSKSSFLRFSAVPFLQTSRPNSVWYTNSSETNEYQIFRLLNHAAEGNIDGLKSLLNSGVNVNSCGYDNRTALHLAASQGNFEAVKLLLERGADVNMMDRFGSTPLNDALQARRSDIASYLRQHGSNLGERQGILIQKVLQSAASGNVDLLVSVFENSFLDVSDCKDYDHRTPLHLAAANGHLEVFHFFYSIFCDYLFLRLTDIFLEDNQIFTEQRS
jgi:ankyrin repeat protein